MEQEQPEQQQQQMKQEQQGEQQPQGQQEYSEPWIVKLRGLPWSVTTQEIIDFFSDCSIQQEAIHLTFTKDGRPSGECFVEIATQEDLTKALAHNDEHMGKRYIEVFESKHSEMEWVVNRMTGEGAVGSETDAVVRLRGLPYGCSKQDIAEFFSGLEIVPYGITITLDQDGRCTGDAYVQFATPAEAEQALQKHKEKIGHRYIEIFKSSKSEIKYVIGPKPKPLMSIRPSPYDRPAQFSGRARGRGGLGASGFNDFGYDDTPAPSGYGAAGSRGRGPRGRAAGRGGGRTGGSGASSQLTVMNSTTGHSLHMRGLPFDSTEDDVHQFFAPHAPVSVRIIYEPNGRPKGEADVDFATHEAATAAMAKHKQNMGRRYIELFLQSTPAGNGWSTGMRNNNTGYGTSKNGNTFGSGGYDYDQGGNTGYSSGYSGYSGYGASRVRGTSMPGVSTSQMDEVYRDNTNFAADVTYPGAGNFFGQQSGYN